MEMKTVGRDGLMNRTFEMLTRSLNFRSTKHQVISGNLANINTPDYKSRKLTFDEELIRATMKKGIELKTTQPEHITGNPAKGGNSFPIDISDKPGGLDIDQEMAKMMQNSLLYEANIKLITKKLQALKNAIDAGRR